MVTFVRSGGVVHAGASVHGGGGTLVACPREARVVRLIDVPTLAQLKVTRRRIVTDVWREEWITLRWSLDANMLHTRSTVHKVEIINGDISLESVTNLPNQTQHKVLLETNVHLMRIKSFRQKDRKKKRSGRSTHAFLGNPDNSRWLWSTCWPCLCPTFRWW